MGPAEFVNAMVENFNPPDALVGKAEQSSFGKAFGMSMSGIGIVHGIEQDVQRILGKYAYDIVDCGFDLERGHYKIAMETTDYEKKVELHWVDFDYDGRFKITVSRVLEDIRVESRKISRDLILAANEILDKELMIDLPDYKRFMCYEGNKDTELQMEIIIRDSNQEIIPKLTTINSIMEKIERDVRKRLDSDR